MADERNTKDHAQAPFTSTFARLGRSVWFTLESSHRADPSRAASLETRLEAADAQMKQIAGMGPWMSVGDFPSRRTWNEEQWRSFLRLWKQYASQVFAVDQDSTPNEEKQLFSAFVTYWTFYTNLPERPENAPEGQTMEGAAKYVDQLLGNFQDRLGDPTVACVVCGRCATGYRLKKCSRCKQVIYCSKKCQQVDWRKTHKRVCAPIQDNPKVISKLVRKRFNELRRQGKDTKVAMRIARTEYDLDKNDNADIGMQVASMFGIPFNNY